MLFRIGSIVMLGDFTHFVVATFDDGSAMVSDGVNGDIVVFPADCDSILY